MRTTSVPRWNTGTSALESVLADKSVASVVVAVEATVDEEFVCTLVRGAVGIVRVVRVVDTGCTATDLDSVLSGARVGWRFAVIGTESFVGRIRSRIMQMGAIDAEIVVIVTEESDIGVQRIRDVFCAHCHTVFSGEAAVDSVVTCTGCSADLTVYYHYSRRHSAYLGYRADSEELQ